MALTVPVAEIVKKTKNPLLGKHKSWERILLGEIATVLNGYAFKSVQFTPKKGTPLIRIRDVGKDTTDTNYVGEYDEKYIVKKGDLLIGMDGDFHSGRWSGPKGLLNQRVCKVVLETEEFSIPFLEYLLPGYLKAINDVTSSVTVKHLSSQSIKEIPLPFPPVNEQKCIVAEIEKQFSRLDDAVENLKRVKANLKRYKASVLKAAVEGKLTEDWRKANPDVEPADKLLDRILVERRKKWEQAELAKMKAKGKMPKDDKWKKKYKEAPQVDESLLPALPNGWAWANLPQLGELNRGKSKHRPRNAPILYGGPYPFVQTGDVRHATGIIKQYTQTYSEKGLKQSRLWPKGTLCITIAANIADTALLGFDGCFPDSVVGFISDTNYIDIRLVEYFIRTAKEDLEHYAPATAQKNINLAILSDVAVPLPPEKEQQIIIDEIEKCLSLSEKIETCVKVNTWRAKQLRQAILKKAFSGQLVPQDAGNESAVTLLKKTG